MAEEEGMNDGRINRGIAHHEFPTEIETRNSPDAEKARQLLRDASFNVESTGNKIILFANGDTASKIAGSSTSQAWLNAGAG